MTTKGWWIKSILNQDEKSTQFMAKTEVSSMVHAAATLHLKFSFLIGRGLILPP